MDGASFTHKDSSPFGQARAPSALACKRPGQGSDFGFTGKWSQESTVEAVAHFMAAIGYGKGVTVAEQYHDRINAEKCSSFVLELFASMFKKSANPRGKLFLQDGNPSQNIVKDRSAWDEVGAQKCTIQHKVQIWTLSKISFILSSGDCVKMLWINREHEKILLPFRKSQDYTGNDTYWCGRQNYALHGQENQWSY